jgi:hypothetical protein
MTKEEFLEKLEHLLQDCTGYSVPDGQTEAALYLAQKAIKGLALVFRFHAGRPAYRWQYPGDKTPPKELF